MFPEHQTAKIHIGNISFSEKELKDIIKAWLAISIAFAIVLTGGLSFSFFMSFIVSAFTVGVGFISHELGHKILAQRYGAWAEFRAWNQMLLLAILMSFFGFVFAAPGAVMIAGRTIGKSRNGKISAMGPAMNFILALIFLPLFIFYKGGIIGMIGNYGFRINTWLGLFNLIPFAMFDGKKILEWNKLIYGIFVAMGVILLVLQYLI